jgi:signal peptidase II
MIIGGAAGNLIDRLVHWGYVVDFIFFRIPEIGYRFAIFNLADASISVGVFLLIVFMLFGSLHRTKDQVEEKQRRAASSRSGPLRSTEQDAKS